MAGMDPVGKHGQVDMPKINIDHWNFRNESWNWSGCPNRCRGDIGGSASFCSFAENHQRCLASFVFIDKKRNTPTSIPHFLSNI